MSSTETFKQQTLTDREHLDPDKHWIGEALPAPSSAEGKSSGITTSAGTSPFPARADHTHDSKLTYSHYYHNNKVVAHGAAAYFDAWVYYYGLNILNAGSTQLFVFPSEGLWQIQVNGGLTTAVALGVGAWFRIRMDFDNVTYTVYTVTEGVYSAAAGHTFNFTWTALILPPMGSSRNFQMRIENYTNQDTTYFVNYLNFNRISTP